ncbi:hypothetical protein L486_03757 [Kwoniella mangroviensis CBS 10435]|uniref:Uncharacterized protein n=1 Tax=Kwoniella mangroviensis CBS 10435 TaxID=1331196 RepID=A0A1B9IV08_9TREE|nr:hypothetical protein L486_03757 [Kwoniella mangroviensis CBS 10435]
MFSNQGQLPSEGSSFYDLHAKGFQGIPNTQVFRAGQQSSDTPTQGVSRAFKLSATAEESKPGSTATSNGVNLAG